MDGDAPRSHDLESAAATMLEDIGRVRRGWRLLLPNAASVRHSVELLNHEGVCGS